MLRLYSNDVMGYEITHFCILLHDTVQEYLLVKSQMSTPFFMKVHVFT